MCRAGWEQGSLQGGHEITYEALRPLESTSGHHALTYLLLLYPGMLGGSGTGQEELRGEERGL